jgi:hypothetical protein
MNYIKKLQTERADLQAQIDRIREAANDLMAYAQSTKFQGSSAIGTYISKHDVIERTRLILNEVNV